MPEKPTTKRPHDTSQPSETDWKRLRNLRDDEIDKSEISEPTPEQFARAIARKGLKPVTRKRQVTLRLDSDVLDWLKAQGPGYQTRINRLLRAYMEASRSSE